MSSLLTRMKSLNVANVSISVKSSEVISHSSMLSRRPVSVDDSMMVKTSFSTVCRSPNRVMSFMKPILTDD